MLIFAEASYIGRITSVLNIAISSDGAWEGAERNGLFLC